MRPFVFAPSSALTLSIFLAPALETPAATAAAETPIDFARDVRPIFLKHCVSCHGGVKRKGKLSLLSSMDAAHVLVAGKPQESELFLRITSNDPDERMPAEGPPLLPAQAEILRRWIAQGANWPGHWAFQPIRRPDVPEVHHPIDHFIQTRLAIAGIKPSPQADRATLIRRLSFDLLGLPPTPAEVAGFIADQSPNAYESLVDRLLASPHFGERFARHWLDLARYADTDGYEVDNTRPNAWHFRDYIIAVINEDMPFDRFTMEQLAGDLLENPTDDQRLATAFHRQTLINKESGIDQEEYRTYAVMDRVSTTATVWLGLTAGCAQCHDHPYDPFTQRDYYSLYAFFNNADEGQFSLPASDAEKARYETAKTRHDQRVNALKDRIAAAADSEKESLAKQLKELEQRAPSTPGIKLDIMVERAEPRITHLLNRGNFQDPDTSKQILPATPAFLPATADRKPQIADRADLAQWILDPSNPLTRRVFVNRLWSHLFGVGLVATPDDFGAAGTPATHPELLDFLADEFSRRWSTKSLIKLIVTSHAYRQSSVHRPELAQIDPTNQLLHRQNRFRVEAEIVRDLSLSVAGLLSSKIGGPSVFPPIPAGLTKIDFRSDMKWPVSTGEDRYRRGMYTFFKRTLPDPNLMAFDCPDASATQVLRMRSNTPLQALTRLNNEVFTEAAGALGRRLMSLNTSDTSRITEAFHLCLSRPPTEKEQAELRTLLAATRDYYNRHPDEAAKLTAPPADIPDHRSELASPADLAAWTTIASTLLNLDEFITRE